MKRFNVFRAIVAIAAFSVFPIAASAQELLPPEGYEYADSVVYRPTAAVDSTLAGKDVFRDMPSRFGGDAATVVVDQSELVENSMRKHIEANETRTIPGYRVRIFFDNRQTARHESEAALEKFTSIYHDVAAYRTYTNPYFKVTVGDCRTKSEAMELLSRIKKNFPSAFVVKENIQFPVIDKDNAYIVDTVKVLRPVAQGL